MASMDSSIRWVSRFVRIRGTSSPIIAWTSPFSVLVFSFFFLSSFFSYLDYISLVILSSGCSHCVDLYVRM